MWIVPNANIPNILLIKKVLRTDVPATLWINWYGWPRKSRTFVLTLVQTKSSLLSPVRPNTVLYTNNKSKCSLLNSRLFRPRQMSLWRYVNYQTSNYQVIKLSNYQTDQTCALWTVVAYFQATLSDTLESVTILTNYILVKVERKV